MRSTPRQQSAMALLAAHPRGLIRHELAAQMRIPLSSVCSIVHALVANGKIIEAGDTRMSPYGQPARVIRLSNASKSAEVSS